MDVDVEVSPVRRSRQLQFADPANTGDSMGLCCNAPLRNWYSSTQGTQRDTRTAAVGLVKTPLRLTPRPPLAT